jgi:hypothetical protein
LEARSLPGQQLPAGHGKDLAVQFWKGSVARDAFRGLSCVPSESVVLNLRSAIENGELAMEDSDRFCKTYSLVPTIDAREPGCKFLDFSLELALAFEAIATVRRGRP